ncbi:MAG: branched-chain amino acid ABC transporter permease [Acidimicrobiales bacterium]
MAYFVIGVVFACLYALSATGLVVTYTTSGIFNFGHGAIGMFAAFVYWQLSVGWGVPWPLALALVLLVIAPLMGAVIERAVVRPLYGASLGVTLVVTLGLLLFFLFLADKLWKPTTTRRLPDLFPGQVKLFGVVVTDFQLMVVVVSIGVALGLRFLFTRTRTGITMRAVVDDRELTARSGASPVRTAQLSWAIGASLAALAAILIAPINQLDQLNLTLLVIDGYAAAVVGRMKSLPLTVAGAVVLGMLQSYARGYLPISLMSDLTPVIPVIMLFVVLLVFPQDRLRTARLGAAKIRRITSFKISVAAAIFFIAAATVTAHQLTPGNLIIFGAGITIGIVALSSVLLTGYAGQVSLCQMTFAGLGGFCMGKIAGGDSFVGLLAAIALPAVVGALLAVVVIRLRGLYLALATLAFASGMESIFFNRQLSFGGTLAVGRFGLHSQQGFLFEVIVLFAILGVAVLALRRGPFGRQLAAMNDSELACTSIGMNVTFTKVIAFTLAAAIAGIGGAAYGGWQQQISTSDFAMLQSLILLLILALGGIATVGGAFAAALFFATRPIIQSHISLDPNLLVGIGAVSLGRNQGGIAGQLADASEFIRRRFGRPARSPTRVVEAREGEEAKLVSVTG